MGGYERRSEPAFLPDGPAGRRIPPDFNGRLLEDDWDRFEEITENSKRRVPAMDEVTITKLINGPEAFTPDNEFCLGETEVAGFFVAAGFCAHGLAGAGGIGKVMAEWIAEGEPSLDLWHMDMRRFGAQYRSPSYTFARIRETYETYYDIRYPNHERSGGRPLRVSAANPWHAEHGAAFGEKSGWERVNWYESNAGAAAATSRCAPAAGRASTGRRRSAPSTGPPAKLSRSSTRARSRRWRSGPGAAELLERLCDNRVAREVGKITYTQMLNTRGGIECDFTVARLAEERFQIVTGTAFGNRQVRHGGVGRRAAHVRRRLRPLLPRARLGQGAIPLPALLLLIVAFFAKVPRGVPLAAAVGGPGGPPVPPRDQLAGHAPLRHAARLERLPPVRRLHGSSHGGEERGGDRGITRTSRVELQGDQAPSPPGISLAATAACCCLWDGSGSRASCLLRSL